MQKNLFVLALIIMHVDSFGQSIYRVSAIPDSLKQGATVVKRSEEISFQVIDVDKAIYTSHKVITLLNKDAQKSLFFYTFTYKYRSLEDLEIKVYDKTGSQIMKYRKKDLNKQPNGEGLIEDGMYIYILIAAPSYPLTIELNYEIKYSGTFDFPPYEIQDNGEAVEQSTFIMKVPRDLGARYKAQKIILPPQITEDNNNITYTWTITHLLARKEEIRSAGDSWIHPAIVIAPNKFKLYNSYGNMSTWKDFGLWELGLCKGRDILPEDRKLFFRDLVRDAISDREKIALVYKYLQQNFRYVSIQLGIGGYQPFPAKFTDEKKYGDCKALSFYTYSVLKSLGIKSHIALINANYNEEPVDPSFPCNHFNHVILCVPQKSDSIWLECTARILDFNYLGNFTENRLALLITEEGGVLVPTPRSNPYKNRFSVHTYIGLHEDGSGHTLSSICGTGDHRSEMDYVLTSKKDEQKNFMINSLGFKQPDNFLLKRIDPENLQMDLEIEKVPQFTAGTRMFLNPRIYSFWSTILPSSKGRKQDYFFYEVEDKTDTTVYQLPDGFTVEVLPVPVDKKCTYASYSTNYSYEKDKNQLTSTARLVLYKNSIPANEYAGVKDFFDQVLADDTQKMIIKKN